MLPASIIIYQDGQKKKKKKNHCTSLDHLCVEQIWTQIWSALDFGADYINEALIGLTTTVAITIKTTSKPQCGF